MIGKDELNNFKEMWTWLLAYPAHDREYYVKHVAQKVPAWDNCCPLADSRSPDNCNGCQLLWKSYKGNLCTDPDAPVYKWQNTERQQPDKRSFYASQTAILAVRLSRQLERQASNCALRRKAA